MGAGGGVASAPFRLRLLPKGCVLGMWWWRVDPSNSDLAGGGGGAAGSILCRRVNCALPSARAQAQAMPGCRQNLVIMLLVHH